MQTILESKTSTRTVSPTEQVVKTKAASIAAVPKLADEAVIKPQYSAPFYLYSLKKENSAPPFNKPDKEPRPKVLVGSIISENEVIAMIAATDEDTERKKFLGEFLVEKKIVNSYNLSEKNFLISLLMETIDYGAQRDFNAFKLSVLLTIYLDAHRYFKWFYWQTPAALWNYFNEVMIRHTIEDSPDGQEVFEPDESYDIISHFHTIYLSNLPLIHIVTFGSTRLKLTWPFKPK